MKIGRIKLVDFEGSTNISELHGPYVTPPCVGIVTEDGKRLVATMRAFGFDGGDETRIRAEAQHLVDSWNKFVD